jgi:hypothetical protein
MTGFPDSRDRDRDGDGVPNRYDRHPRQPESFLTAQPESERKCHENDCQDSAVGDYDFARPRLR